jgi:hypothetical protein
VQALAGVHRYVRDSPWGQDADIEAAFLAEVGHATRGGARGSHLPLLCCDPEAGLFFPGGARGGSGARGAREAAVAAQGGARLRRVVLMARLARRAREWLQRQ